MALMCANLIILALLSLLNFVNGKNHVFKTESGSYILRTFDGKARKIQNYETLEFLDVNVEEVLPISNEELSKLATDVDVPLLGISPQANADDTIGMVLTRILTMQSNHFVVKTVDLPYFANPAIVKVHDRILIVGNTIPFWHCDLLFGWMDEETLTYNPEEYHYNLGKNTVMPRNSYTRIQSDVRLASLTPAQQPQAIEHTGVIRAESSSSSSRRYYIGTEEILVTFASQTQEKGRFSFFKLLFPPLLPTKNQGPVHHNRGLGSNPLYDLTANAIESESNEQKPADTGTIKSDKTQSTGDQKSQHTSPAATAELSRQFTTLKSSNYQEQPAVFGNTEELTYPAGGAYTKSWVAFSHNASVYFLEKVNPMHLLKLDDQGDSSGRTRASKRDRELGASLNVTEKQYPNITSGKINSSASTLPVTHNLEENTPNAQSGQQQQQQRRSASNIKQESDAVKELPTRILAEEQQPDLIAKVKTIVKDNNVDLPWIKKYGSFIRGGTDALLINTHHKEHHKHNATQYERDFVETEEYVYISFFHTVAAAQLPHFGLHTYFMGAMTQCSRPPFNVHSMSAYPILINEGYYKVAWFPKTNYDYVLYPSGLMQSSFDKNHLLMSYGHQDKYAYISVFDIQKLLASMSFVAHCK